jgi:hypothetical protein
MGRDEGRLQVLNGKSFFLWESKPEGGRELESTERGLINIPKNLFKVLSKYVVLSAYP